MELFYRQKVTSDLVGLDDRGRYRRKVELFERFAALRDVEVTNLTLSEKSQFIGSPHEASVLARMLLDRTPFFENGNFDTELVMDGSDLNEFVAFVVKHKQHVETLLGVEVRSDIEAKAVQQLGAILKQIGLRLVKCGAAKRSGQKVYRYKLDQAALDQIRAIVAARTQWRAWYFVYRLNGWDTEELRNDRWE
jgi:hypothetical protein